MNNLIVFLIIILAFVGAFKIESTINDVVVIPQEQVDREINKIYNDCLKHHTIINKVVNDDCKKIAINNAQHK